MDTNALYTEWKADASKRAAALERSTIADGAMGAVPGMPDEPNWHLAGVGRPAFKPNFLALALKMLSYLYDSSPIRTMADEDEATWMDTHLWRFGYGLDAAMGEADRLARLHGECLLYGRYIHDLDAPPIQPGEDAITGDEDADGIEWVAIPRTHYYAALNAADPRYVDAVAIRLGSATSKTETLVCWDATSLSRLVDGQPQRIGENGETEIPHGYGTIPCVRVLNSTSWTAALAPVGIGGADMLANLRYTLWLLDRFGWAAALSPGQPWATGKPKNWVRSPENLIELNAGEQFGIAPSASDLAGMRDAVLIALEALSKTTGLPTRTFRINPSEAQSGAAIAMERAELEDDRKSREKIFAAVERAAHRISAAIYRAETGRSVGDGRLQSVTYNPWARSYADDYVIVARVNAMTALGVMGGDDALRELYPQASEAEIQARLQRADEWRTIMRGEKTEDAEAEALRMAAVARASDPLAGLLG